jgi:two-component system, sensor histidine kinase
MSTGAPIQILLVDDRPENLLALEAVLEGRGYTLVKAESGRQALKLLLEQHFRWCCSTCRCPT